MSAGKQSIEANIVTEPLKVGVGIVTRSPVIGVDITGSQIAGGDKHYLYSQEQASDEWVIVHNLDKYPSVTVVDTERTEVIADVEYIDTNTVRVTFNAPFAGFAYLN